MNMTVFENYILSLNEINEQKMKIQLCNCILSLKVNIIIFFKPIDIKLK